MKYVIILIASFVVSGCSMFGLGEANVKDIDTEKEEQKRIRELREKLGKDGYIPTPPIVMVGEKDNIKIITEKAPPLNEKDYSREVWHVYAENSNPIDKCVFIQWKLMDFEYISDETTTFLMRAKTRRPVGTMLQRVYNIDGLKFTAPASGYLNDMSVRDANKKARRGDECMFFDEKAVKTK